MKAIKLDFSEPDVNENAKTMGVSHPCRYICSWLIEQIQKKNERPLEIAESLLFSSNESLRELLVGDILRVPSHLFGVETLQLLQG